MLLRLLPALALSASAIFAADLDSALFEKLEWRNIGPASMGGRITAIRGIPGDPGTSMSPQRLADYSRRSTPERRGPPIFDHQNTISIGDIAVDPHNPDVVWLGAGEANARNSVSFGDGVYRTLDGGKTWRNMGLSATHHISRVVVNPLNSNIVYVAALGHNTGPNADRGVYMTTDGGETWKNVLYIDAGHGCADLDIDVNNPNILYATMWRFERKPWMFISGSEKTGVFRSMDAGRTWSALTTGLPKGLGRIGVRVAPSNSNVVYVVAESNEGTLFRSDDRGDHFHMMTKNPAVVGRGLYYAHITIDPTDENRVYSIGMQLMSSIDAGHTWKRLAGRYSRRLPHRLGGPEKSKPYLDRRGRRHRRLLRSRRDVGSHSQFRDRAVLSDLTPIIAGRFITSRAACRTTEPGAAPAARKAPAFSTTTGATSAAATDSM